MKDIKKTLEGRDELYGGIDQVCNLTFDLMEVVRTHSRYPKLSKVHVEVLHMIFHKIGRMVCGDPMYVDNPHDIAGYALLLEDFINHQFNDWGGSDERV